MLNFLAQNSEGAGAGIAALIGLIVLAIYLGIIILIIAGMWKTFIKAGKPGWAAIVPIYNVIIVLEIVGKPLWWIILFLIPIVNVVMVFIVSNEVSKCFGRGIGTTLGLIFLPFVFWPILGFGSAQYKGAASPQPIAA